MVISKKILMSVDEEDIKDGTFIVPPEVKSINFQAFKDLTNLRNIVIPDSVQTIGFSAFQNCTNLKSVKLPANLTEISKKMFQDCTSLEKIDIPNGITAIGLDSFFNCASLKEINIPSSVEKIDSGAFSDCSSLKQISLPQKVIAITSNMFSNCTSLESVELSKSTFIFHNDAFKNCISLKNINIPKSLKFIGESAFEHCSNLEEIDLPETLNSVNNGAFKDCVKLKKVVFPKSFYNLKANTFENCSSLEEVSLSNDLINIESYAFAGCHSLKNINLPETVKTIEQSVFRNCYELENIEIPKDVLSISDYAFKNCKKLTNVTLPVGVKVIGTQAFFGCENLSNIDLKSKMIVKIKENAFSECPSLKKLKIPYSVKSMKTIQNSGMKHFEKTPSGFTLSSEPTNDSIPLEKIKIDYAMFYHNFDYKNIIFKEQNNPIVADFYENFLLTLTSDKIEEFFRNHNFTFLKQLKIDPSRYNFNVYKFLYNMGAMKGDVVDCTLDENNFVKSYKTVNYAQKVVGFIQEKLKKENVDIYQFVSRYSAMQCCGFKRDFTDFYLKSYDELVRQDDIQKNFISNSYENFYKIQQTNTSNRGSQRQLKPTVDKFINYFAHDKFIGVKKENEEIAKTISPYFDYQHSFDKAVRIDNERKRKRIRNNILSMPLRENDMFDGINYYADEIKMEQIKVARNLVSTADNEFSFEWLEKNDPQNFILGKLCNCCAHLDGYGYGIMRASIVHPYIQNLVIRNKSGEIVAKTTLYVNHKKGYGVCNNVEVSLNAQKGKNLEKIYEKVKLGLGEFANAYNKEHPKKKLRQINVGMHLNDLTDQISEKDKVGKILKAINYEKYCNGSFSYDGDSSISQYILWSDEDVPMQEK